MSPCCKHSEKLFLRVAGLHNYETRFEILSPYKKAVAAASPIVLSHCMIKHFRK